MTDFTHNNDSPTILILGAVYDTGNMGVDALLSGTITSILKNNPESKIKVLDYGHSPRVDKFLTESTPRDLPLINLRFSYKLHLKNNGFRILALAALSRLIPYPPFRSFIKKTHPHLAEIDNADICVSLAGGDSFADIYGMRRLLYVSLPQLIAISLKKPLVLLPQTLGPFKSWAAKRIAALIMRKAVRVYSRDKDSLHHAKSLIGRDARNLAFSRDMAFALEPLQPADHLTSFLKNRDRPLTGLNVSGLLYMGGYTGKNDFGLSMDYPKIIESIIELFINKLGTDIVLVTHVTGAPGGIESDATTSQDIFEKSKSRFGDRLILASPQLNHREVKYVIGKCDFFLGARMHACIAALSQAVPAVGMAYSRKFRGVFETLEVPELVLDLRKDPEDGALEKIEKLYNERRKLSQTLAGTAKIAKSDAHRIFADILSDFPKKQSLHISAEGKEQAIVT